MPRRAGIRQCPNCGTNFTRPYSLKLHIQKNICNYRTDVQTYNCHLCSKKYLHQGRLKNHLLQHKNKNTMTCSKCKKPCKTRKELFAHYKQAHYGGKYVIKCRKCGQTFNDRKQFHKHYTKNHLFGGKEHFQKRPFSSADAPWTASALEKSTQIKSPSQNHIAQQNFNDGGPPISSRWYNDALSTTLHQNTMEDANLSQSGENTNQHYVSNIHASLPSVTKPDDRINQPSHLQDNVVSQSHTSENTDLHHASNNDVHLSPATKSDEMINQPPRTIDGSSSQDDTAQHANQPMQFDNQKLQEAYDDNIPFILKPHKIGMLYLLFIIYLFIYDFIFNS